MVPAIYDSTLADDRVAMPTEEAYAMCRRLAREEGIFAGISSGAAVWAAVQVASRPENAGKLLVAITSPGMPVPLSPITTGEVGALLTRTRLLVMLPDTVGVKLSEKFVDCPGGTVSGKVRPLTLKPAPGPASCVILRLPLPVLLTIIA